jgi:hypothetical protein
VLAQNSTSLAPAPQGQWNISMLKLQEARLLINDGRTKEFGGRKKGRKKQGG